MHALNNARTIIAVCILAVLASGCGGVSPVSEASLDRLQESCGAGDMADCDALYIEAPSGSQYEDFGDTCGGRTDGSEFCDTSPDDDVDEQLAALDPEAQDTLLDFGFNAGWDSLTESEQANICDVGGTMGFGLLAAQFSAGSEGLISPEDAESRLITACG